MNPTTYGTVARRALTLGLLAGTWLTLAAFAPAIDAPLQPGGAPETATSTRILVAQAAGPVEAPVSYANDQADRGEEDYTQYCEECHGEDLRGGLLGGPPLRGLSFESKFAEGAPASAMFEYMKATMPPNSPGRFSDSTYADIMAFILKRNSFQPGAPLPSDPDALNYLLVQK